MEMSLQVQRPLNCKTAFGDRGGCLKLKPFSGFFPHAATGHRSSPWRSECKAGWGWGAYCINASADFSRSGKKKASTARRMGAASKGVIPKQPIGTTDQKRDKKNTRVKGDSVAPIVSEISGDDKKTDGKIDADEEEAVEISQEENFEVVDRTPIVSGISGDDKTIDVKINADEEEAAEISQEENFEVVDRTPIVSGISGDDKTIDLKIDADEEEAVEISQEENFEVVDRTPIVSGISGDDKTIDVKIDADEEEAAEISQEENFEVVDRTPIVSGISGDDKTIDLKIDADEEEAVEISQEENVEVVDRTPIVSEISGDDKTIDVKIDADEEEAVEISQEENFEVVDRTPIVSGISGDDKTIDVKIDADEEEVVEISQEENFEVVDRTDEIAGEVGELSLLDETLGVSKSNQDGEIGNISVTDEDVLKLQKKEISYIGDVGNVKDLEERPLDYAEIDETIGETYTDTDDEVIEETIRETNTDTGDKLYEEASRLLKLELEANLRKQEIERIAEENFSQGTKLFVYPPVVKPDQDIEVFLNRSISTLSNDPDVLIMGAFNNWRWKSFTNRLNKTHLKGDWWSCQVHVPREAYKVDFVFFNGQNVYDNNDEKDFSVPVDGGMDAFAFEDFLLEEKRKELEKLAKEQAEKERQAEEQRRMEAEKAAQEADRSQARLETERSRETLQQLMKNAVKSIDNVWYIEPSEFKGKDLVRLYYHRSSGPLAHAKEVWVHGGHNNWKDGLSIVERLVKSGSKDGDWWHADVVVPDQALVLDWVFADGPPQHAFVYDNNHNEDFHAIVTMAIPDEQYWFEEEQLIYRKLQEERKLREEAIRAKAEKTAHMKAETKERTLKRFLLSQKHIVFTEPLDVQAGSTVTVFYNPSNTNLNGKPEVWFRCSFNRWSHRNGPLPPQRMLPADNGNHVKTSVKVPLDAYMMDFVFSESQDGGIFDNKYGMDYHIPVFGGIVKEPPLHIIHISVEMAPIAKVGGMGDVVTSLSRVVQDLNHNVDIVLPKYDCLNFSNVKDFQYHKNYFWGDTEINVWHGKVEGLSVYFLEPQNGFFQVRCVYGRGNDAERFGFFCHAALEFLLQNGFHPDIIHCHDWPSAPVAWLFKDHYAHYGLSKARVVFTIHNLEFGAHFIGKAMAYTDKATTVSLTYSREVSGNPAVAPHLHKFHGIINGIDPDIWDPYNDKFIPVSYTSENVVEGKRASKEALQRKLNLKTADLPLVGVITRLTHQKGIHLIKHAIWRALERGGQVVLLGSAPDPRIQNDFVNLANQLHSSHNDRARLCLAYDEPLSHLIYAGADFILVPSIFEPCGLTQLIAMRYGAIPVVRKTGGLYDTVFDVDRDRDRAQTQDLEPNGFSFDGADAGGVDYALNRAISAWYDGRDWFNTLCKTVMEQDWSWNRPALDYLELYHAARKSA